MKATFVDDEKLIAALKKRPFMYDTDDPQHSNRRLLISCWKEIAEEVGHEIHAVKERWISMRDYYRKKVRELELIKAGSLNKRFKKWSMYDKLSFLKPHLRHLEIKRSNGSTVAPKRPESDIDTDEEGVQINIVKTENTDEDDDDDNQSDDSYRRDVVQALDPGFGSVELPLNKSAHKVNTALGKRRAEQPMKEDNQSFKSNACSSAKRQRLEATPVSLVNPSSVFREDSAGEINTNKHFFTSLIPLIDTLEPIEAMEFRHEVHGVLLRYLKESRDKQRAQTLLQAPMNNYAKVSDRGDASDDTYVVTLEPENCNSVKSIVEFEDNSGNQGPTIVSLS